MISDEVLGMFELSNDLLFGRIPEDKYRYYVEEPLRLGREAAEKVKGAGGIFALYEEAGIEIIYQEASGENYGVSFRAQSEYGKDGSAKVLMYKQSIAELAKHSCDYVIGEEEALAVHHAFIIWVSQREIKDDRTQPYYSHGFVSDYLEPVQLVKLFGRRRQAGILRCSEIAAHAFAKEMMGLEILPNYYDYTWLMAGGKLRREDFLEKARQFEEMVRMR
ncbi:hypothetical protein [Hungatella sp.]|uniref:hypothetical protein n=1 Tax=Hungatella sp. TaxID=2613924 RepID=UPI0039960F1E